MTNNIVFWSFIKTAVEFDICYYYSQENRRNKSFWFQFTKAAGEYTISFPNYACIFLSISLNISNTCIFIFSIYPIFTNFHVWIEYDEACWWWFIFSESSEVGLESTQVSGNIFRNVNLMRKNVNVNFTKWKYRVQKYQVSIEKSQFDKFSQNFKIFYVPAIFISSVYPSKAYFETIWKRVREKKSENS